MDFKPILIDALETLRKREVAAKQPFKARAYTTVLQQLQAIQGPIRYMSEVEGLKGVGAKIREKMEEIFETGALAAAERAKADPTLTQLETFQKIHGVGPAKAKELVKAGITSLEDLQTRGLHLLTTTQRVGLTYYQDLQQRIPRAEMEDHARFLESYIGQKLPYVIAGSYRRGAATSGDIDVVFSAEDATHAVPHFQHILKSLKAAGYLVAILAEGDKKCMAVCRLGPHTTCRRIDLLLTPREEYPFALLHFTGSAQYNIRMSQAALDRGYTLGEHGMKPVRAGVPPVPPMTTEKDICDFLGVAYLPPHER